VARPLGRERQEYGYPSNIAGLTAESLTLTFVRQLCFEARTKASGTIEVPWDGAKVEPLWSWYKAASSVAGSAADQHSSVYEIWHSLTVAGQLDNMRWCKRGCFSPPWAVKFNN